MWLDELNGEQRAVVDAVLQGHNVFLTGGKWLAKLVVNGGASPICFGKDEN